LTQIKGAQVTIPDWVKEAGGFDPLYLHLENE
jgi:hypothetical protein